MSLSRTEFARLLGRRLNRKYTLIDYEKVVVWKNKSGVFNQATMFQPSRDEHDNIVINQFKELSRSFDESLALPLFRIVCYGYELCEMIEWIVRWNIAQERGEPLPEGVYWYSHPPWLEGASSRVHEKAMRDQEEGERDFLRSLREKNRK